MSSFGEQARGARQRSKAMAQNRIWTQQQRGYGTMKYAINNKDTKRIDQSIRTKSFNAFAQKAYAAEDGYAIRVNPMTGEKEMFVRGTTFKRHGVEWFQNIAEHPSLNWTYSQKASKKHRDRHSDKLSKIAKANNVNILYGHSRGAPIMDAMKVPRATKLGLDGAMLLRNDKSDTLNYRQKQLFDRAINGPYHQNTVGTSKWYHLGRDDYHQVYGIKSKAKNPYRAKGTRTKMQRLKKTFMRF
jgi:hypothetical protein